MKRIIIGSIVAVAALAAVVVTVSGSKPSTSMGDMGHMQHSTTQPASSEPVMTNAVTIQDFAFSPAKVVIHKGDTITWTNQDEAHHNVNIINGPEKSEGPLLAKGETYQKTFNQAGTYEYNCRPHPYMKATIEVQE